MDFSTISPASPKASVLLPVYNAEAYLEQAARSVLCQTFKDFELLLLNDGSSDRSAAIIDRLVKEDSRCRALAWPNQGLVASLNTGLEAARGEIIIRMDADDICHPERFERQIDYLTANPTCVAIGAKVMLIDPEGLPIMAMGLLRQHAEIDSGNLAGNGSMICHPAVAMRASALRKVGGYRAEYEYAEDLDLFLRLAEIGQLTNLNEILLEYRQHPASIGYAKRAAQVRSISAAIDDARRRRAQGTNQATVTEAKPFTAQTRSEVHRMWSWWALSAGHVMTARKHARIALAFDTLDWQNWKLLLCAVRGY
jgi:glycosyltransferase involved in cell wall biosynthesis